MKKIGKFRRWLIKILGGEVVIPMPTEPIIIEKTPPSVKLESKLSISYDMLNWYRYMGGEEKIKKKLWEGFFEKASPYMVCKAFDNPKGMGLECRARLTVLREEQNG